jgi:nickel-type superoxide dismutase maturation protease
VVGQRGLSIARTVPGAYSLLAFFAAKRFVVRGRSMMPVLLPGDSVLFDRLAYRLEEPQVGDIVLARHPARPGVRFIKRVAERNGLAPDELWLLGDNAGESTDSRTLGPFSRADFIARAWVVYWPRERFRVINRP